jgi:DNA-binding transcriptional regulator YiaG
MHTAYTSNELSRLQPNCWSGPIIIYFKTGTLGLLSFDSLKASKATSNSALNIETDQQNDNFSDEMSKHSRDIKRIREATKISISELSKVFGVSRQSMHEWIRGGTLSPRNAKKLSELAQATDVLLESNIELSPQVFRRKIAGGSSIFDALKEENGKIEELARMLATTLARESQQRERLALRFANRPHHSHAPKELGSPHLKEDL